MPVVKLPANLVRSRDELEKFMNKHVGRIIVDWDVFYFKAMDNSIFGEKPDQFSCWIRDEKKVPFILLYFSGKTV